MSKKFIHLDDTNFPNVEGVNPFKYHNNFDYSRWRGLVAIKLVNVKWNSNYTDVPKWDNDNLRDNWFDNIEGIIRPLETLFNITPENTVRIPVPYNDAYNYNYLVVDMPIQTSTNEPIAYEDENIRIKRWYYFIDDMVQYSPNTTELKVTLDYWTMFINTVDIPYLMLERGHAPMVQTDVNTFLQNPIENCEYLLADDFNFGDNTTIIKNTNYYPIGNGSKYVLFALPFNKLDFQSLIPGGNLGDSTPATFSDTSHERWGYQYQVNGYEWNYGGKNYNNSSLPVNTITSNDGNLFNGVNVYAIKADEASAFFTKLSEKYAYVMNAIQACFILASDMFARNDSFIFETHTIYTCIKTTEVENITLNKTDFDFEPKYSEITKLYTFPYSVLEITDDNGNVFEIKVENTSGNVQMHNEINIAYPYMNYTILFTGINGNGTQQYIWSEISANRNKTIWEDDFSKFMMIWDIPTFSLFMSAETDFNVTNYPRMQAERNGAVVDYMNAVRYADVGYENTEDSLSTQKTNTINSASTSQINTKNAASTDKINADNQANTTKGVNDNTANVNKTNADNQANVNKTNADNQANTNRTNADNLSNINKRNADATTNINKINNDATSNQNKNNADADTNTNYANTRDILDATVTNIVVDGFHLDYLNKEWNNWILREETNLNSTKLYEDYVTDNNYMVAAYNGQVEAQMLSTAVNIGAAVASAAVGGVGAIAGAAGGAAVAGGAILGGAAGANAIISGVSSSAATTIAITKERVLIDAAIEQARLKQVKARTLMDNIKDKRIEYNDNNYSNAILQNEKIARRNKKTGDDNNKRSNIKDLRNNERTNDRELKNNERLNDTNLANNTRLNNTELTNNDNTQRMHLDNNDNTWRMQLDNNDNTWRMNLDNNASINRMQLQNNTNTRDLIHENADRTYGTDFANANRIYDTEEPNARWNRESAIEAAKWNLGQKQLEMESVYKSANLSKPVIKTNTQGDVNPDLWERRGIRVNVRTQNKSAIAQTGDAMLRFGYALNRVWDMDNGFNYMRHFTYWKAADVWINDGSGTAGDAVGIIQAILLAGVTVWNNPTEIGTVSIYENLEY